MEPPLNPKDRFLMQLKERSNKLSTPKIYGDRLYPFLLIGLVIVSFGLMLGAFVKLLSMATNQPNSNQSNPNLPTPTLSASPTPDIGLKIEPNTENPSSTIMTLAKFNQIQNGMTITQVQKLIGNEGKLLGSSSSGNITGKVFWWQNPEGSNALVEFKNDQVVSKSQAGLK